MAADTLSKAVVQAKEVIFNASPWPDGDSRYLWLVYIPVTVWILLVIALVIVLLKKYTFGKWTVENPNPYAMETMGLPRGAFRGIITLSLLFAVVLFEVINIKVGGQFEKQIDGLLMAFQMMIAFYFGAKVMHHMSSTDRQKTKVIAESMAASSGASADQSGTSFDDPDAAG